MTQEGNQPSESASESAESILNSLHPLPIDMDCLNCGYNLRGLYGNPIRCPECFQESPRVVPEALNHECEHRHPARDEVILNDLVSRGTLVAVALAFPLVFGLGAAVIQRGWVFWFMPTMSRVAVPVSTVGFLLLWIKCRGIEGWFIAFCHYLPVATVSIAINIILIGSVVISTTILLEQAGCGFILMVMLVVGVLFKNPMVGLNELARNQLRPIAARIFLHELEQENTQSKN